MRLDEWQKFIESEFLDAEPPKPAPKTEEESTDVEPTLQGGSHVEGVPETNWPTRLSPPA